MPKLIQYKGHRECPTCDESASELYDMSDSGKGIRCYRCRTRTEIGPKKPVVFISDGYYNKSQLLEFLNHVTTLPFK